MKKIFKLFLMLVLIFLVGCEKDQNKPGGIDNPVEKKAPYPGLTIDNDSEYTNGFYEYYDKKGKEFCMYDDKERCGQEKIFIKTESADASKYYEHEDKYVYYKDNGKIKVYDHKNKVTYVVNIPSTYIGYDFCVDSVTGDLVGLIYRENIDANQSYYSIEKDKVLYDKKYGELYFLSKDYLSGFDQTCKENSYCQQTGVNLLDSREENVHLTYKLKVNSSGYYEERKTFGLLQNEKGTYICLETYIDAAIYEVIYTNQYKEITKKVGEFSADIGSDGYLYVVDNKGIVTSYDQNGNKVKSSNKMNVTQQLGEYSVVIASNKISLYTISGEKIEIADFEKKYQNYELFFSKFYNPSKISIVVNDSRVKLNDVWSKCSENNICNETTKEDLADYSFGYKYEVDLTTKEVKKTTIAIGY